MINVSGINNSNNAARSVNYKPLTSLKNLFHASPAIGSRYPGVVLRICLSAYNSNQTFFFLSLKRIREYVSRSLLHQAASSEREDNGAWVEAMCRGVAEYVGSLRVVVTSDGHTMRVPPTFSIKSIFLINYSHACCHARSNSRSKRFYALRA